MLWLVTLQATLLPGQVFDPNNTNLTFMLITSFGQFGFNSSGVVPAAEMALEDINNNPDVLPGYNLVYDSIRDSQVHEYYNKISPVHHKVPCVVILEIGKRISY